MGSADHPTENQLSVSFGIMKTQLKGSPETPRASRQYGTECLMENSQLSPHRAECLIINGG